MCGTGSIFEGYSKCLSIKLSLDTESNEIYSIWSKTFVDVAMFVHHCRYAEKQIFESVF